MTARTDQIIANVIKAEGGYVNDTADRGGPTNFGITQAVARANGYTGDMRDMPVALAQAIYEKRYITEPRFGDVVALHPAIGEELIDTGVNMGPSRAAEFLQRWLNGFNFDGSRYGDLFVDGRLGSLSIDALRKFLAWRGAEGGNVLLRALNCVQGARYLQIAEADKSQRKFLYGWMKERVS